MALTMTDADRIRRLRAASTTGYVPADLIPWLIDLAASVDSACGTMSPSERLAVAAAAEIDRWMQRRGVSSRTLATPRRTLARALKAMDVRLSSVADIADALDCEVEIRLRPRRGGAISGTSGAASGTTS
jgi:hypothetical protein